MSQKGMHLVHHALFYTLARGGQFVLTGDAQYHHGINDHFWRLKRRLNDNPDCHLEIGYREDLAHLIYAGADILVAPSMFEPCGLAGPADRDAVRDGARGPGHWRHERHRLRPRQLRPPTG
jgi:glycogen synthase